MAITNDHKLQTLAAFSWLQEEAEEGLESLRDGNDPMVIDALFDALGICLVTLNSLPDEEVSKAFTAYEKAQTDRDRRIDVPHHIMITRLVETMPEHEKGNSQKILDWKLDKIEGQIAAEIDRQEGGK